MIRATQHAEKELNRHNPPDETWIKVDKISYPAIHEAFETISHDSGFGAGHASYYVPWVYTGILLYHERVLNEMPEQLRNEFVCGDQAVSDYLCERIGSLSDLHDFLNHFFEDFEDVDV